jgi:hypothetical protein
MIIILSILFLIPLWCAGYTLWVKRNNQVADAKRSVE